MVEHNPFSEVKAGSRQTPIACCSSPARRDRQGDGRSPVDPMAGLIALSRYGGLRVPSEAFPLRWADIDWDGRMFVRSPKTEHHDGGAGGGCRCSPNSASTCSPRSSRPSRAPSGCLGLRPGYNPHTEFRRIIVRAGVEPWPRNLAQPPGKPAVRTRLRVPDQHRVPVAGQLPACRRRARPHPRDADWQRAIGGGAESGAHTAQIAAQHAPASDRTDRPDSSQSVDDAGVLRDPTGRQSPGSGLKWA
jgi:hypothetical protein